MNMRKLLSLLLALCLVLGLAACASGDDPTPTQTAPTTTAPTETEPMETEPTETEPVETEPAESVITPLLYKVSDDQGNVIWLFGSIHVGEDYFYPLPDYVIDAYEGADALAVECDIVAFESDLSAQMEALRPLVYADGSTIRDHIPEDLYNSAKEVMSEYGMYASAMDYYCPSLWSSFIDSALYQEMDLDASLGIDMYFLNRAHDEGKKILEVESAQFQYAMLGGFSEELQTILLEASVENAGKLEESKEDLMALVHAWASGDEALIISLLYVEEDIESDEEAALAEEYENAMITSRNLSMTDFAEDALLSGEEVFICVGTAHVVGEGAMADLLAQRGYTVEIVGK